MKTEELELEDKLSTRDRIRAAMRWDFIVTGISVLNPLVALPQFIKLWQEHQSAGVSTLSLSLIFLIQAGFSLHGFFLRDRFLSLSNGCAAAMTVAVIASVYLVR